MHYTVIREDTETGQEYRQEFTDELKAVHSWRSAELYENTTPKALDVYTGHDYQCHRFKANEITVSRGAFHVDGMTLADWTEAMFSD